MNSLFLCLESMCVCVDRQYPPPPPPPSPCIHTHTPTIQAAEAALTRATELQPDLPKAWKALADLWEAQEAWGKAVGPLEVLMGGSHQSLTRACTTPTEQINQKHTNTNS